MKHQTLLALSISILLHLFVILPNFLIIEKVNHGLEERKLLVEIQNPTKRIVPESEIIHSVKKKTARLASKDSFTPIESLRRGEESSTKRSQPIEEPASRPKTPKETKSRGLPLPKLRLSPELASLSIGAINPKSDYNTSNPSQLNQVREKQFLEAKPFHRLSDLSSKKGNFGSSAHLPNIPDGQITLLNAKADKHAVFVRRVALQVFGKLKLTSWNDLSYAELSKLRNFSEIEAIMSPKGKLLNVEVRKKSGQVDFDKALLSSGSKGVWDSNPPKGAVAADGNIHFVFRARTWARKVGEPAQERRWLLMATGLL